MKLQHAILDRVAFEIKLGHEIGVLKQCQSLWSSDNTPENMLASMKTYENPLKSMKKNNIKA